MSNLDNLVYRKDALMKRRSELLHQIGSCSDEIGRIDRELADLGL